MVKKHEAAQKKAALCIFNVQSENNVKVDNLPFDILHRKQTKAVLLSANLNYLVTFGLRKQ